MANDPYAELGVARTATPDDIRRAYRQLAKELHPDARPDDPAAEERFKRVTAAFRVLNDPETRARYDRGEIDADGQERGFSDQRRGPNPMDDAFPDLDDILSGLFGRDAPGGFRSRGEDVRYRLQVEFVEAALGGRKRVVMGDGRALDLVLPEGVKEGQVLRLKGQGRGGARGAPPGDALVEIDIATHAFFDRRGDDIHMELPITLSEAVLGAKIRVPTVSGPVSMTIPKGSDSGAVLRLRGRGVKGERARGDQFVRLMVMTPERPTSALVKALEDFDEPPLHDDRRPT